ncbi:hypothetical protein F5X99DRAFT_403272 [Biscogniauxia marginata]|nr:hypothetical protein F5X99DRAFT_403272 [Biscogniauxia marginata]
MLFPFYFYKYYHLHIHGIRICRKETMHRALSSRWLKDALNIADRPARLELPLFLCPSAKSIRLRPRPSADPSLSQPRGLPWNIHRRGLHTPADPSTATSLDLGSSVIQPAPAHKLPKQCTGCGAFSQASHPNMPGYYDLERKAVRRYLGVEPSFRRSRHEDKIFEDALKHFDHEELAKRGVDVQALALSAAPTDDGSQHITKPPLCDRCHYLMHNHTGESIYHPDIDSIRDTLMESPYKYNHVYHVLDAADFPMSLLPRISQLLELMPLRTKNRRSRTERFYHGQKTELSFIITRSDLLAPTKEQVDRLFPYLQSVLRDVLGRSGRNVRLGNMFAVSAKRSWWTKELREEIWKRGGAGWMVGKANVGKSQLFEAVFPKGRMDWAPSRHQITVDMHARSANRRDKKVPEIVPGVQENQEVDELDMLEGETLSKYSLLPPAPEETQYPAMPLVSDLPGTTASPIRVPFGNGRGELIDLPGLERTGLEQYVPKEHRLSLIMKSRIVPEQITLKPGQSLLIGGFIRITPREPAPIMLTYAFTPIKPHGTRTDKAIEIQKQDTLVNVENISVPGTGDKIELAGSFELKWDVTKQRTGPLTRRSAIGLSVDRLPYRVLATDILIEGVGWVEVVAQVRTRHLFEETPGGEKPEGEEATEEKKTEEKTAEENVEKELTAWEKFEAAIEDPKKKLRSEIRKGLPAWGQGEAGTEGPEKQLLREPNWPIVDVYSPEGKFISCRPPMNGWLLNKPLVTSKHTRSRPRKSMKGAKKLMKKRRRESEAAASAAS